MARHPLGVAFDDHVEAVLPRVDAGRDGDSGGVREIACLLLLWARTEHEPVVDPRAHQRRGVRAAVVADGGQPVQLRTGQRVGDLAPVEGLFGFAESSIELALSRHTDTDRAAARNSSKTRPPKLMLRE